MTTSRPFGYVWCPECGVTKAREYEVQPLPFCHPCGHWMEPYLCDRPGCEEEAITLGNGGLGFCRHHVVAVAA